MAQSGQEPAKAAPLDRDDPLPLAQQLDSQGHSHRALCLFPPLPWWLALGALLALATIVDAKRPLPLDSTVRHWLNTVVIARSSGAQHFWTAISLPGEHLSGIAVIVLLVAAGFWFAGDRRAAVLLPALVAGASGSNLLLKWLVGRHRPVPDDSITFGPDQYGFPSGHVVQYVCLFGFLAWWCWAHIEQVPPKALLIGLAAALIALVGPSRLLLDAHWTSDVLAGYLHGYLWLHAGIVACSWSGQIASPSPSDRTRGSASQLA